MIIGVHGRKQCGKSSVAKFIREILPEKEVKEIAFAKPLKDAVHDIFGVAKKHLYGTDAEKDYPLCTWGEVFTGVACTAYGKGDRDLLSGREIMQLWGTEVMRQGRMDFLHLEAEKQSRYFIQKTFGANTNPFNDIWVDMAMMDMKIIRALGQVDIFTISDMRFTNEFESVKKNGGKTIRLYRDTKCEESIVHSSERQLEEIQDEEFDYVLTEPENVNLKQLKTFVTKVLWDTGFLATGGIAV